LREPAFLRRQILEDRRLNERFRRVEEIIKVYRDRESRKRVESWRKGVSKARWMMGSAKSGSWMLQSALLSAQGGDPLPAAAWVGDEARIGAPTHALVELVRRFGMDRIVFDRLVEHFPLRRSAAERDRRRFARLADAGHNGPRGRRLGDKGVGTLVSYKMEACPGTGL
jgi:hypothetical protein